MIFASLPVGFGSAVVNGFWAPTPGSIGVAINGENVATFDENGLATNTTSSTITAPSNLIVLTPDSPGATWDATHDVGAAINAAIVTLGAAGGGTVMLPAGTYGVSTPIVQPYNGVHLVGAGVGTTRDSLAPTTWRGITRLVWIGAAGATMLTVEPPTLADLCLMSADVRGIAFDGASLAGICAKISQVSNSVFDIGVSEPRSIGAYFTTTATLNGPGMQNCEIWVRSRSTNAAYSPTGILFDGQAGPSWNVSYNRIRLAYAVYYKGDGIVFGDADNNLIDDLRTSPMPSATGSPVIFAAPGYTMPNGLTTNSTQGQPARANRVLHIGTPISLQGFIIGSSIVAGGGNTGTVTFPAVVVSTSGSTAFGTTTVALTSTTGLAAGMTINAGSPLSGIDNNSNIGSITNATTLKMNTPTIATVATATACTFTYGFTQSAVAGTYTLAATGASTYNLTAPAGGNSQTGVVASGGTLVFTDLVFPIAGSAVNGDTWTILAATPAVGNVLEFIDKDNPTPSPHYMTGATGWFSTSSAMIPRQASPTIGIDLGFTNEVLDGSRPATPGARAVQIGGSGGGATGVNSTVINGASNSASGTGAIALGGKNHTVSGDFAAAVGSTNTANGTGSWASGIQSTARGEAVETNASGAFSSVGDAQRRRGVMFGLPTVNSGRLTLRGLTPSASNGFVIGTNTVYKISVHGVSASELGNRANWATWNLGQGALHREAGNAAYVGDYSSATTPSQSGGAASTATIQIAADTTFQTLSITITWPNGNTVHAVADVSTVEVN